MRLPLEIRRTADVVPVMVGHQNRPQREVVCFERLLHKGSIAGVHDECVIRAAPVQVDEVGGAGDFDRNHVGHDLASLFAVSINLLASSGPTIRSSFRRVQEASSSKPAIR